MTLVVVDGYNMLGGWPYEPPLDLEDARRRLVDELINFAGATGARVVVVFDGHATVRNARESHKASRDVEVVFSRKGETADHVIERYVDSLLARESVGADIRVASSDALVQSIVLSRGATRMSAREMYVWMDNVREQTRQFINSRRRIKTPMENEMSEALKDKLETLRREAGL